MSIPMTFVIFDVLRRDGVELTGAPDIERRSALKSLALDGHWCVTVKNPNYWRGAAEREAVARSKERRARTRV